MSINVKFTAPYLLSGMPADTPMLLALSGGADSSALLHMLCGYCKDTGAQISVAHVNHMIRGKNAERDRDFCKNIAQSLGIPFYLLEADIPALAKANKRGLEEEARITRYAFFEKVMKENGIPLLVTAHNATDNAETVIFNITRGSGLHGLCGIPPTRGFSGGKIIRPLLKMSKDDILAYCKENSVGFVTDETNADVAYSRNRIRNNVLPELALINENAVANISRACELLRLDDDFICRCSNEFIKELDDRHVVPLNKLNSLDSALTARIASELLGDFFEVSHAHVASFVALTEKAIPHSESVFPNRTRAIIENGTVILTQEGPQKTADYFYRLSPGENRIAETDTVILITDAEKFEENHVALKNIYKNSITALISSDTIDKGLCIRPKKDGDKILSGGMHKKLKKLFGEKKLSLKERSLIPVFVSGEEIVWVPGVAVCDGEKKKKPAKRVIYFYNR